MTKEKGLELIKERVEDFEKNKALVMKKGYGETNIRSNYIDEMFKALGWDVTNKFEVDREFSQKDKSKEGNTKKVDYAFKINSRLKFFIEAKEASVDLENNRDAIYQAKRYAYSSNGKAPIVILTDFEEFRVFNVLTAPKHNNPDKELLKKHCLQYTDYVKKWDILWDTFSRDAVENGSLDKLRGKITKNTKTMDKEFLEQITNWREILAKNIAIRNEDLTVDEINEAVQRILDRLIFIRNLEDREIEPENTLLNICKKKEDIHKSLQPIFRNLDSTYNGLLYKPHFSEEISVDDKTLYQIIREMCYPVSPFQFDIIEPEILGRIYEKFLGSKIRLTDNHRAKVEEKPEVRHAGGVYYTPEYIVDFIIEYTVGKKIKGLTPKEIQKIKILDPACGSGSFLLGAYNYLLDYHKKWYEKNKTKKEYKNDWYLSEDGVITVTLDKRGAILKNNIFGVDIDREATEVAIMSLYLKMLDDGFDKGQLDLFFVKGHLLPSMTSNVKCGNSLIDMNFFNDYMFEDELTRKINPFGWDDEFAVIFSENKGFDVIIGNPPYIRVQELDYTFIDYCKKKFSTAWKRIDISTLFIEKANSLINQEGLIGYITSNQFLSTEYGRKCRAFLIDECNIQKIIDYGDLPVFKGALTYVSIFILSKGISSDFPYTRIKSLDTKLNESPTYDISIKTLSDEPWILESKEKKELLSKITGRYPALSNNAKCWAGLFTGKDKILMFDEGELENLPFEKEILLPVIRAQDCSQYGYSQPSKYVIYPYKESNGKTLLLEKKELMTKYPLAYNYLKENKKELLTRKDSRKEFSENKSWYSLTRFGKHSIFHQPKIVSPGEVKNNKFALDKTGSGFSCARVFAITSLNPELDLKALLAVLNSKLVEFYLHSIAPLKQGGYYSYSSTFIDSVPLPDVLTNNKDKRISKLVELVDQLMISKVEIQSQKLERSINQIERKILFLEKEVNKLVYDLYELEEADIILIEKEN